MATRRARASLGPSVSRVPRSSSVGLGGGGGGGGGFQRFGISGPSGGRRVSGIGGGEPWMGGFGVSGMTEKDIEDKVSENFDLGFLDCFLGWVRLDRGVGLFFLSSG
jgi:hypothetical protein